MPKARYVSVNILDTGDLDVEGLGVVKNPLIDNVTVAPLDLGELWYRIWSEDLHNNPNTTRIKAILLNLMDMSVGEILGVIKEV